MSYALRYRVDVVWIPPGRGLGMSAAEQLGPSLTGGDAQVLTFIDSPTNSANSSTFTSTDVTNMTNAMAADISAQMSAAAVLARVQAFATGGG